MLKTLCLNKPVTKRTNTAQFHLRKVPTESNSETKIRTVVVKGSEERAMGNYCLMGIEFKFCKMKFCERMVKIVALNYTVKNGLDGKFYVIRILPVFFKKNK